MAKLEREVTRQLGEALCASFGLDASNITKMVLTIGIDERPTVEVTMAVPATDEAPTLKRYTLVEKED